MPPRKVDESRLHVGFLRQRPTGRDAIVHTLFIASPAKLPITGSSVQAMIEGVRDRLFDNWMHAKLSNLPQFTWYQRATAEVATLTTYNEAVSGPQKKQWETAIAEELRSLALNNVWELVDNPRDSTVGVQGQAATQPQHRQVQGKANGKGGHVTLRRRLWRNFAPVYPWRACVSYSR